MLICPARDPVIVWFSKENSYTKMMDFANMSKCATFLTFMPGVMTRILENNLLVSLHFQNFASFVFY